MNEQKYKEDLKDIRDIMDRSSRFRATSGLSFISIGIIGLAGAFIAKSMVFDPNEVLVMEPVSMASGTVNQLLIIAALTLILAIVSVTVFTFREAGRQDLAVWDHQTKRLLINLAIPLITGGLISLILLGSGYIGMLPSMTLIFYGLALLHISKYSLEEIRTLGIIEVILGILSLYFIEYSLWFWICGFGIIHIIFGFILLSRYRS